MGNIIKDGRSYLAATGNGESTDPYVQAFNAYQDTVEKTVTFAVDTSILADGDLASDKVKITDIARVAGYPVNLRSIKLIDKADQKSALYVVFLNADLTLGSLNGAPTISDANALATVIGHVKIAATDYVDLGGAAVATKILDNPLPLTPTTAETSLWVALVSNGTPTYGAAGDVVGIFGFSRT